MYLTCRLQGDRKKSCCSRGKSMTRKSARKNPEQWTAYKLKCAGEITQIL